MPSVKSSDHYIIIEVFSVCLFFLSITHKCSIFSLKKLKVIQSCLLIESQLGQRGRCFSLLHVLICKCRAIWEVQSPMRILHSYTSSPQNSQRIWNLWTLAIWSFFPIWHLSSVFMFVFIIIALIKRYSILFRVCEAIKRGDNSKRRRWSGDCSTPDRICQFNRFFLFLKLDVHSGEN